MTLPRLAGLLAALAIALVAGCSLTRPSPVKNTFAAAKAFAVAWPIIAPGATKNSL